jgi:hypothetical protein
MTWSNDISTEFHFIKSPLIPEGANIDVEFTCPKCEQQLKVDSLQVPRIGAGDTESKSSRWGQTQTVESLCGESYDVTANNSIAGWMLEFENNNGLRPKTFRFKISTS